MVICILLVACWIDERLAANWANENQLYINYSECLVRHFLDNTLKFHIKCYISAIKAIQDVYYGCQA